MELSRFIGKIFPLKGREKIKSYPKIEKRLKEIVFESIVDYVKATTFHSCPGCGSMQLKEVRREERMRILSLFPVRNKYLKCEKCGFISEIEDILEKKLFKLKIPHEDKEAIRKELFKSMQQAFNAEPSIAPTDERVKFILG